MPDKNSKVDDSQSNEVSTQNQTSSKNIEPQLGSITLSELLKYDGPNFTIDIGPATL